jgi:hypothetical protein
MIRRSIALMVFLYPAWLTLNAVAIGLPSLFANFVAGQPLGRLEIRPFAILFTSAPLIEFLAFHREGPTIYSACVLAALAAVAFAIRSRSAAAAALLVLPASLLIGIRALDPWERSVPGMILAVAGLLAGQRLFLSGSTAPYLVRALLAWLPLATALLGITTWFMGRRGPRAGWTGAAVLAVTALAAAIPRPQLRQARPNPRPCRRIHTHHRFASNFAQSPGLPESRASPGDAPATRRYAGRLP